MELHGLFPKICKTMFDTVSVLRVVSEETTILSDSVQETMDRSGLRLDRKPGQVADYRMKAIGVDCQVVDRNVKRTSPRVS